MFICILNGCAIDKLGLRFSLGYLIAFLNVGQIMAYLSLKSGYLLFFFFGKILCSICGLNYIIVCGKYMSEYYVGKGLTIWNSVLIFFSMSG